MHKVNIMGVTLLITVFFVSFFAMLSSLSYNYSYREYNYSQQSAENTALYYKAYGEVNEKIKEIQDLYSIEIDSKEEYFSYIYQNCTDLMLSKDENYLFGIYTYDINDIQHFEVTFEFKYENGNGFVEVVSYEKKLSNEWVSDEHMELYIK